LLKISAVLDTLSKINETNRLDTLLTALCRAIFDLTSVESIAIISLEDATSKAYFQRNSEEIYPSIPDKTSFNLASIPVDLNYSLSSKRENGYIFFRQISIGIFVSSAKDTLPSDDDIEILRSIQTYASKTIDRLVINPESNRFSQMVEEAVTAVGGKRGSLHWLNSETNNLILLGTFNRSFGPIIGIGSGLSGQLLNSQQSFLIEHNYNKSPFAHPSYGGNRPYPSVIKILLKWNNVPIGVLSVDDEMSHQFDEDDARKLLELSKYIASELVASDLPTRLARLNAITGDIARVSAEGKRTETLKLIVHELRSLLNAGSVTLYTYDLRTMQFSYGLSSGTTEDQVDIIGKNVEAKSIFVNLSYEHDIYQVTDVKRDPFAVSNEFINTEKVVSYIAVLLKISKQATGRGMIFVNFTKRHLFTKDEINTIQLFANLATVAIENDYLNNNLKNANTYIEILFNAAIQINKSTELDRVGQILTEKAVQLLNCPENCVSFSHLSLIENGKLNYLAINTNFNSNVTLSKLNEFSQQTGKMGIAGNAVVTGEVQNIYPVETDANYIVIMPEVKAQVSIPIELNNKPIGALSIEKSEPTLFSDEQIANFKALGALAAIAIQRVNQSNYVNHLLEASLHITRPAQMIDVFTKLLRSICGLLRCESAGLREYDKAHGNLDLIAQYNRGTPSITLKVGEGFAGRIVMNRGPEVLIIPDYHKWIRENNESERLYVLQQGAILAVRVSWNNDPIGVLFVSDKLGREFTDIEVEQLNAYAPIMATALMNYRLSNRLEQAEKISSEVGNQMVGLNLTEALSRIVSLAKELMRCDIVVLYQLDPRTGGLKNPPIFTEVSYPENMHQTGEVKRTSPIYWIVENNKPLIVDNPSKAIFANKSAGSFGKRFLALEGIKAYIAVPLNIQSDNVTEVVGIMFAHYREDNKKFKDTEINDFEQFAKQSAIAIKNRRDHEEWIRRVNSLEAFRRSTAAIVSASHQNEIFRLIIKSAASIISINHPGKITGVVHQIGFNENKGYFIEDSFPEPPNGIYAPSRLELGKGVTWQTVRDRKTYVFPEITEYTPIVHENLYGYGIRAMIAMPLIYDDQILGVLFLNDTTPRDFTTIKEVLESLASQAAIAINKARNLQAIKDLEEKHSYFTSTIAHEFRDSLTTAHRYVEILTSNRSIDIDGRGDLSTMSRTVEHLRFVVNNLLSRENVLKDVIPFDPSTFDIAKLVYEVTTEIYKSDINDLSSKVYIVKKLPTVGTVFVFSDEGILRIVVQNLLLNALKFTPPPGTVYIQLDVEDSEVKISIQDTGIGMSADQMEQIFDDGYQVEKGHKRKYDGIGIGLYLVKRLLQQCNSKIFVSSTLGQGSEFWFKLPVDFIDQKGIARGPNIGDR